MRKELLMSLAFLCATGFFTACSNDDDKDAGKEYKALEGTYGSGDTSALELTYGGSPMLGGSVEFVANGDNKGTLKLTNLIPGELATEVGVTLSPVTRADAASYNVSGSDTKDGRSVNVQGTIEKGKLSLALTVTMPSSDLSGTSWKPVDFAPAQGKSPLHFVWESAEGTLINIPGLTPAPMPTATFAQAIAYNEEYAGLLSVALQSLAFQNDGNVVAAYTKMETGAKETSPLNFAHYYVKDSKLYALLNLTQIMAQIDTKSRANVTPVSVLESYLTTGFPLGYRIDGNAAQIYLDQHVIGSLLSDQASVTMLTALLGVANLDAETQTMIATILPVIATALSKTTKLEIGLNLVKN